MNGKSKWVLQKSWYGELRNRADTHEDPWTFKKILRLCCSQCYEQWTNGLGNDAPAVTEGDLCIGAQMHGWEFTPEGQYCGKCWARFGVRASSWIRRYLEGWARLGYALLGNVGGVIGAFLGSTTLGVVLWIGLSTLVLILSWYWGAGGEVTDVVSN